MAQDDSRFSQVPLNVDEQNPCSPPEPSPTFHGVVINAPKQVRFRPGDKIGETGAFAAIPICGVYSIDMGSETTTSEPLTLYALEKGGGNVYSGEVVSLDPSPRMPLPPGVAEKLAPKKEPGLFVGGYFNPNLADFVRLPQRSGTYDVHVQLRGLKSNTVSIELIRQSP